MISRALAYDFEEYGNVVVPEYFERMEQIALHGRVYPEDLDLEESAVAEFKTELAWLRLKAIEADAETAFAKRWPTHPRNPANR